MPETAAEPAALSPTKLFVARLCIILLVGMILAVLFGDFVVWVILGTQFLLSPRFHGLSPYFQGLGVLLLYLFLWQSYQNWRQGEAHYILIEFFVLVIGGIPLARFVTGFAAKVTVVAPIVGVPRSYTSLFIPILLLVLGFACKLLTLSKIWRIVASVFASQEQRRIVTSD